MTLMLFEEEDADRLCLIFNDRGRTEESANAITYIKKKYGYYQANRAVVLMKNEKVDLNLGVCWQYNTYW